MGTFGLVSESSSASCAVLSSCRSSELMFFCGCKSLTLGEVGLDKGLDFFDVEPFLASVAPMACTTMMGQDSGSDLPSRIDLVKLRQTAC